MDYVSGLIGFAGFEALRVYKRLWAGLPVTPLRSKWLYLIALVLIGAFSAVLAYTISNGNIGQGIFIGFSIPAGIKAIVARPQELSADFVDDIDGESEFSLPRYLHCAILDYFGG